MRDLINREAFFKAAGKRLGSFMTISALENRYVSKIERMLESPTV